MSTPLIQTTLPGHVSATSRSIVSLLLHAHGALANLLNRLRPIFALSVRLYVSWVFLKSGWLKISSWDVTLSLFQDEYHVPLLPPALAAVVGTAGELFFPILLILGLAGRISALGLFAVNAMAVISYAHVLFAEGFEAAIGQHYLWGFMLLGLAIYGPGSISADRLIAVRSGTTRTW
jgi:putative oxidoreductase